MCTCENQVSFRLIRPYIDQIFTLKQVLDHRHMFHELIISIFRDLKAAFDSVDRGVIWHCLSLIGESDIFISLIQRVHKNTWGRVPVWSDLTPEFTRKKVFSRFAPFHFLFLVLSFRRLQRWLCPYVKIVALGFAQTGICLTWKTRMTLWYQVKIKVSCEFSPIAWTIMSGCSWCFLHL